MMNLTGKCIPFPNGSLMFWEPDTIAFSSEDGIRRGIVYATHFLGKQERDGFLFYQFSSPKPIGENISGISFQIPLENNNEFHRTLKNLSTEIVALLNGGNLLIQYASEDENSLQDLLTLLLLTQNSSGDLRDIPVSDSPFNRSLEKWKKEFLELDFQFFKEKISPYKKNVEITDVGSAFSPPLPQETEVQVENNPHEPNPLPEENIFPKLEEKNSFQEKTPSIEREDENASTTQSTDSIATDPKTEVSENGEESVVTLVEETESSSNSNKIPSETNSTANANTDSTNSTVNDKIEENSKENSTSDSSDTAHRINTKFSIQLKMMGIISLILAITVSTIIALATYFFKDDSEKRVQLNNLAMVDLVGLKVSSDIQSIVAKGEQLVTSMLRPNLSNEEKKFISSLFFSNDKDFIYVGVYGKENELLVSERNYFNVDNLIESNILEDEVLENIKRNEENILRAFSGKPIIINSTPGFSQSSFVLALPANMNMNEAKILVIMVKLDKILPAFEKKDIVTTFMVNDEGKAIAHPVEDVILSSTNFMDLPIVQAMLTSQVDVGQIRYTAKDGSPYMGSYKKIGFGDAGIISIVSENKAFEEVYNIQERNLYIMAISLCLALVIVFFFAKSLSSPILSLLYATLEIAKGNFRIGIKPTTRDEVGLLTKYFITMGEGLEEREKVKSILGSMIDPVVVKEAMVDLAALKRGKESEITAFFSDVASFSTISEQLTSVDLASLLNEYLSAMTIILKENEGVLDKYIGDAIVGIFGAPVDVEHHAMKASKASLEMVYKLEDLRQYWQKNNLYSKEAQVMDARIGLNTGPAKVGFMGTDALASYTMMGDTVNLAARLEAAGKDYGVNVMIAENTNQLVQGEMVTRILDLVRVKGKNEPVRVYELVSFKSNISDFLSSAVGYYEEGFNLYLKQEWDSAIKKFELANQAKGGKDKSSKMLIERCLAYKSNNPGKDWDGVFTRTTK